MSLSQSANRSVPWRWVASVVGVLIAGGLAWGLIKRAEPPHALVADLNTSTENVQKLHKAREISFLGFGSLGARGQLPIHIESATVLGVPDGMVVEGLYFVYAKDVGNNPLGATERIRPYLRPVDSVVFDPPKEEELWSLMAGVSATQPGSFRTRGLRVCYTVNGRRGCENYPNKIIGVDLKRQPKENA